MDFKEKIKQLTAIGGVSAFETEIAAFLEKELARYCGKVHMDEFHNVIGYRRCKNEDAKTVLLEAHLDRIGLMVSDIDENGFVAFVNLGGVDERILPGAEVYLLGKSKKLYGVIGAKPPHLLSKEDEGKAAKIENMLIDTGLTREELQEQISVGTPVLLKSEYHELLGGRLSAPAMDNRAGVAAVLACLEQLTDDCPYHIAVLFASQEELGLHGALTGTLQIMPDMAIVVDVTHGATPETEKMAGVFPLGSGAAIGRGPNVEYDRTLELIQTARERQIPYTIEALAGASGTDAWVIQTLKSGVPVVLISIPLRYMHTTVETLDVRDVENVAALMAAALNGGVFHA